MAGITGMGTTFNLPNYHGELFGLTPEDTPLLSAIGGLGSGSEITSKEWEWQAYDLRDPAQRVALEGQTAPTGEARVRTNFSNVVQIVHERVSTSYTKQAAIGQFAANSAPISGANPITDEHDWQVTQAVKQIARDVNWTCINGQYAKPSDNSSPRKTRGLMQAVSAANTVDRGSNVATGASSVTDTITPASAHSLSVGDVVFFTRTGDATGITTGRPYWVQSVSTTVSFKVAASKGGTALTVGSSTANIDYHSVASSATVLSVDDVNVFAQRVWDGGGLTDGLGVFLCNSSQKIALSKAYADAYGKAVPVTQGEKVGGVVVERLLTDFGPINIMVDRAMPQDALLLTSLSQLKLQFLLIPGKGSFFEEPLAKTGASEDTQIYGEVGLEYGSPLAHGVLRGLPFRGM
ncbi:SU10 major capsid protein [Actinosynnema mirum]|uniref:Uncharacterized protein n=1 Tax=Actinosynnema mirum (strain ATCC 29888 / DSM 43827 / JCM 3225 / NBRC 14064 / NCIMB 13271 / NRRL B-12336 / IMRU 3971 / 101) TaxID=446462 RepID=C6WBM6_ACTMD|nr:DUF5309 family protein [Actinosynnema mirum]ACU35594.1 hypothetical protein Amir_1645 [Actinosynnema mirum DSM 43827]